MNFSRRCGQCELIFVSEDDNFILSVYQNHLTDGTLAFTSQLFHAVFVSVNSALLKHKRSETDICVSTCFFNN